MPSRRKFYRTTFLVTVLSEEPGCSDCSLKDLAEEMDNGPLVGTVETTEEDVVLDGPATARLLIKMNSDPAFFQLDPDGNDTDD